MTRADGDVSPIEVQAVQDMMRVPESELKNMERVFGWRRKMSPVLTAMPDK